MQQNVHKKREKRGIRKRKRGKRKEIVTTLGSRDVGDERGNPQVMGMRRGSLQLSFYLRP